MEEFARHIWIKQIQVRIEGVGGSRIWARAQQNQQNDVCPGNTQLSLGIRPVWSESSLFAWRNIGSLATENVQNKESDPAGRMPGWTESLLGAQVFSLILSCSGSFGLLPLFVWDCEMKDWF